MIANQYNHNNTTTNNNTNNTTTNNNTNNHTTNNNNTKFNCKYKCVKAPGTWPSLLKSEC